MKSKIVKDSDPSPLHFVGGISLEEPKRILYRVLRILLLIFILFWTIFPIYWLFSLSIRGSEELREGLALIPQTFTTNHFQDLFSRFDFLTSLKNSLIITVISVIISLLSGVAASYVLMRQHFFFPQRKVYFFWVLLTRLMPPIAFAIPLYFLFNRFGFSGSLGTVISAHLILNMPLIIWFLMTSVEQIPVSIEEASRIDGASEWQIFVQMVIPQILPSIAAVAMLSFMASWNDYLYSVIFIQSPRNFTVPLTLATMNSEQELTQWGVLGAGGVISTIPVVLFVMFAQRYLIEGLAGSAVKG